jgi:hypothetical protein
MARRHQQLEDSLKLHQFLHDVEDEQTWMREREPLASDTDLGNTLTSVQILLKKHKVCVYTLGIIVIVAEIYLNTQHISIHSS